VLVLHRKILVSIFSLIMFAVPYQLMAKEIVGWVENVAIHPGNIQIKAKIDSGATTSSLHCDCQQFFMKGDEQWVRFTITTNQDEKVQLERKVNRMAKIKRHYGESQDRAVITLGVCLGTNYKEAEVNLVDRSGFNYQMLIGRNFLAGHFLIDSSETFINAPSCDIETVIENE
jgi:hypothetical protein